MFCYKTIWNTRKSIFVLDVAASRVRPVKELKSFQKIGILASASKKVEFTITTSELGFYNDKWNMS